MNKEKETNKKNYVFAIIILSVVLAVSLFYNFFGGFNLKNVVKYQYEVGDDCVLKLETIGAKSLSFAIEGTSLPGDIIKQDFKVVLPDIETSNLILRAKVILNDELLNISGYNSWQKEDDASYYIFNDNLYKNQTVGVFSEFTLPEDIYLKNDYVYYVNVLIELFYEAGLNG